MSRQKPEGVKEEDYIPELPTSGSEPGILPTEIRKLVDSRRAVKSLLKDPNISEDQRMQYDIRQVRPGLGPNTETRAPKWLYQSAKNSQIPLDASGRVPKFFLPTIMGHQTVDHAFWRSG